MDTIHSCIRILLLAALTSFASGAIPFTQNFDDATTEGWESAGEFNGRGEGGELRIVEGQEGNCLSVRGEYKIALWARRGLPEELEIDGPCYVTADIRSLGDAGPVWLRVRVHDYWRNDVSGVNGYDATDGWTRAIWDVDGFRRDHDPAGVPLTINGIGFVQFGPTDHHELQIDNVKVHTGEDARKIAAECERLAGQRSYDGPLKFEIGRRDGVTAWHAPSTAKIFEADNPPTRGDSRIRLSAARNEAESFQIALRSEEARTSLSLRLTPLTGAKGAMIPAAAWYWRPVLFVPTASRYFSIPIQQRWPDPLSLDQTFSLAPHVTRPVWVTLDVPTSATAGVYRSKLDILEDGDVIFSVPIEARVYDFALPRRMSFRTNQQIYPQMLKSLSHDQQTHLLDLLTRYRQFSGQLDFWPADLQERMINEGRINTIKIPFKGGSQGWKTARIHKLKGAEIMTEAYKQNLLSLLDSRAKRYREEGLMKYCFVYLWDEPEGSPKIFEMINWLSGIVKEYDPDLRSLLAGAYVPEVADAADIFLSTYSGPEQIKEGLKRGVEFWRWGNDAFYIDMPGVDQRMRYGLEGVQKQIVGSYCWSLGWWSNRYNKKPFDPIDYLSTPDQYNFNAAGFYPGGHALSRSKALMPSISLELNRDGIEDFEYVTMLKKKTAQAKERGESAETKRMEKLIRRCEAFYKDPEGLRKDFRAVDDLLDLRERIARALEP